MLAIAFLAATVVTAFGKPKNNLVSSFSDRERRVYEHIIKERRTIYFKGLFLGLIVAYMAVNGIFPTKPSIGSSSPGTKRASKGTRVFTGLAIAFTVQYFFYMLHPKSTYMIQHFDSHHERVEWMKIKRHMQVQWHGAFILGLIASYFVLQSSC